MCGVGVVAGAASFGSSTSCDGGGDGRLLQLKQLLLQRGKLAYSGLWSVQLIPAMEEEAAWIREKAAELEWLWQR